MTLLEDIVTYLTSLGLVEGDGVDVYRDFKPESPDNIVSLHEYQGDPVSPYTDVVHRSVQVVVRNRSAVEAQALAIKLFKAFVPTSETLRIDFTPTRWGQVHIRQTPHKFSQDESDRIHYGFNLGITTSINE
jgi:hypothetical protein